MSKAFLIVGGSGTVGSELAKSLKEAGHTVRTTTSKPPKSSDQVRVDLLTGEGSDAAFSGIRRAFLMAPSGHPDQYRILSPLIRKAKEAGLEKVVLMSAIGVEANEAAPLRRAEVELEKSGLAYNIIRPSWFMQNFNTYWLHDIRERGAIRVPAGSGKAGFIDSRDISATAAALLSGDGFANQAMTLTGPKALDHHEAAGILSAATGKEIGYQDIGEAEFKRGLLTVGVPADYVDLLAMLMGFLKAGYNSAVTDSVQTVLGRAPVGLEAYARDFKKAWS